MNPRSLIAGIALAAGLVWLAGCTSNTNNSNPAKGPSSPDKHETGALRPTRSGQLPTENDTLLLSYVADPATINPLTSNDTASEEFQLLVYESLATRKYGNPDEWEPGLAESWEFDPKTLTYTIHLRKGVKWHPMALPNGKMLPETEFTARDVKFTFDCILNPNVEAPAYRSYFTDPNAKEASEKYKIELISVPGDKYTIKIRWKKPYFLADEWTLGINIIPQHVFSVDKNGERISADFSSKEFADGFNNHWANTQMCGTGPMVFKEWAKGQRAVLERNPDYWDKPFYFSKLVFQYNSNQNTAVQKALHNDLDWVEIIEKELYVKSKSHPNVVAGKAALRDYRYPAFSYVGYNLKRDFFRDKKVRWALGHAIPADDIIKNIYYGLAERTTGPFLLGSSSYDKTLKPLEYDPEKAKAMLDEAGWKLMPGDAVRSKVVKGVKQDAAFELILRAESAQYLNVATTIQDKLRQIGVKVDLKPLKWDLLTEKSELKDFDAILIGWALGWKQDPFQIWDGSQANEPRSSNSIGYQNPEVDKLIEQLRVTMEPEKQNEIYHQIHRLIYEDQPYTFLLVPRATAAFDGRIENAQFYPIRPCVDFREWYAKSPRLLGL